MTKDLHWNNTVTFRIMYVCTLYFFKMCPFLVGSIDNLGKRDMKKETNLKFKSLMDSNVQRTIT